MGSICSNCNEIVSQNDTDTYIVNELQYSIEDVEDGSQIDELIKKLDEDAFAKVKKLSRSPEGVVDLGCALIGIMKEGANEFKEKTGRNMSYAEMRAAYG